MSNVLIGIIGVVLFIGLAIAGALFLGPRFSQTKLQTTAAQVAQAVSQTARAAALRNVDLGTRLPADPAIATTLETAGYMKNGVGNPTMQAKPAIGSEYAMHGVAENGGSVSEGVAVVMRLSSERISDAELCAEIERLSFHGPIATTDGVPNGADGCFRAGPGVGAGMTAGAHYSYSRI